MRQKLGQHFLNDLNVIKTAVINLPKPTDDLLVVEVGPGQGVLTRELLNAGYQVLAIEWDEELLASLQAEFSGQKRLHLINADIRTFDLVKQIKSLKFSRYVIAANLPYYLSSYFLRSVFGYQLLPEKMVLLLQQEVAQRLAAEVGSKKRSTLSILAQSYCRPEVILSVPASSFTPPPKVTSALVEMDQIKNPFKSNEESKRFFRVVKAGFGEKRKTIINSLAGGMHLEKDEIGLMLSELKIDSTLRAEDLSIEQWRKLTQEFEI
ncbi:MAG: 16S rRNA (adenine(1518)-N(6)/adenine(1519)-N(6))-dimethyltransferase RsmA [Patescibacteria group bacterium]|jgi:16S rRNA (adenine1518-N6/adenine1519-N6)-dimethyltransferase